MVSSTTYCSSLTEDILIEIFTHLPLNSIYKIKSLSKVWLFNLSQPNFIIKWFHINCESLPWILYYSIHDRRITDDDDDKFPMKSKMAYNDLHSDFMSRNEHLFSLKLLMDHNPFGARILLLGSSSNGLVLGISRISTAQTRYHVCNPLTQKCVSIPEPPPRTELKGFDVNCIFCECSSSFTSCYKVVRIPQFDEPSKRIHVDIFSSDLGLWERFQVSCDENVVCGRSNFDKVVIHNGVLFWIEGEHRLFVYNLNQINKSEGHQCSLINLPDEEFGDAEFSNARCSIGETEGSVCYAKIRWTGRGMTVSVWMLSEVNWKILHKDISMADIVAEARPRIGKVAPIKLFGFSPVDQNVIFLGCRNWVWRFNIQTRSFEELCLDSRHVRDAGVMFLPFVLKPMPTILPPPSWIGT